MKQEERMKKIWSKTGLAALVLALLTLVVSCGSPAPAATGAPLAPAESTVSTDEWDKGAPKDLQGHDFVFLVSDSSHAHLKRNEVYAESLTGDKVNDAVFQRNAQLEADFHCTVSQELTSDINSCKDTLLAGDYVWDFVYGPLVSMRALSSSNLFADLSALENLDLKKGWYDQNAISGLEIKGHLFYVTGDASTLDERASWVVYFNRDLIEVNRLENPYDLVRNGQWTAEKMFEISEKTYVDANGNGAFDIGTDVAAVISEPLSNWMHVAACNTRLITLDSYGELYLPATVTDEVLQVWAELKPLLTSPHRDVSDAGSRFRKGLGGFFVCNLGTLLNFEDAALNFGVLPMPKRNAEQEKYWTSVNRSIFCVYSIPATVDALEDEAKAAGFQSGREMCGYFLDAFSHASTGTLRDAFYSQVMKKQLARDPDTVEMLDLALENKIYDPSYLYNFGGMGTLFLECGSNGGATAGQGKATAGSDVNYDNLVSEYTKKLTAARKALTNYLTFIDEVDNGNL